MLPNVKGDPLRGVRPASLKGRSFVNLDGFAPAGDREQLSVATVKGSMLGRPAALPET